MVKIKDMFYRLIRALYFKLSVSDNDRLNAISLTRPIIYKPTADGNLLIDWGLFFKKSLHGNLPEEVSKVFATIVRTDVEVIDDFDISVIDSCTASSSFGQDYTPVINGSWFKNMTEWGEGMYPVFSKRDSFGRYTEKDWEYNVNHMETNALRGGTADIHHLSWLNRTIFSQGGGSHHTALVLAQKKEQNREYKIKANVSTHYVDHSRLNYLMEEYYLLVTHQSASDDFEGKINDASSIFQSVISASTREVKINERANSAILFVIEKSKLMVREAAFNEWIEKQVTRGTIIQLTDLVKSTLKYCTTPYNHELNRIYLGDSMRRNDRELSRLTREKKEPKTQQ